MAHTSCMLNKQGYMREYACTHPRAQAHASARAHTHTHTHKCVIFIAFPRPEDLQTGVSVTVYVPCLSCNKNDGKCLLRGTKWVFK